ncbi:3-hydroxyisobutyryl-CoA hydrolase [Alphaproteobacteria bacterium LSUCC0684]
MTDLITGKENSTGRLTLNRPDALNALTHDMALLMEDQLNAWRSDDGISQILVDASGEKAFCAGGDIQDLYHHGRAGDFAFGQRFWRDEYRLNTLIAEYPKPFIVLMQGFVMGGGVGVACHGSHRVVGRTSRIALPECSIGLVPDVGSSAILAAAPGRLGDYLATTGYRMNAGDAIHTGFADIFIPEDDWPGITAELIAEGNPDCLKRHALPAPTPDLSGHEPEINALFTTADAATLIRQIESAEGEFAATTAATLRRQSPLSLYGTLGILERLRKEPGLAHALDLEYRFTSRSSAYGDFLEGIRAAIIDRDRSPSWKHASIEDVPDADHLAMLAPLD